MAKRSVGARSVGTLCVDVGGTGLKMMVVSAEAKPVTERTRVETPKPATPKAVLAALAGMLPSHKAPFERVSVGFPGVVMENVVKTAPNLGTEWHGFALGEAMSKLTGKPTRVLNDAGVQGHGVVEGRGVEMCLTLGTGLGCSLFVDGHYVPNLELAHHPFRKGKTYEEYVGNAALDKVGKKRWNQRVERVIAQVAPIWNYRVLYLGGGNARKLAIKLPDNVKVVENVAGLLGGVKLWERD